MITWDAAGFLIGYTGIAVLALWLIDRQHRIAFATLRELYEKEIALLKDTIERLRKGKDAT